MKFCFESTLIHLRDKPEYIDVHFVSLLKQHKIMLTLKNVMNDGNKENTFCCNLSALNLPS